MLQTTHAFARLCYGYVTDPVTYHRDNNRWVNPECDIYDTWPVACAKFIENSSAHIVNWQIDSSFIARPLTAVWAVVLLQCLSTALGVDIFLSLRLRKGTVTAFWKVVEIPTDYANI